MAQFTLGQGETLNGGEKVFGTNTIQGVAASSPGETIYIGGGVQTLGNDFNAGGDKIVLAGSPGQYTVRSSGSTIILEGPNGTVVRIPAPNPNLTAAQQPIIEFDSGTAGLTGTATADDVSFRLASTTAGVFSLTNTVGGAPVVVDGTAQTIPGGAASATLSVSSASVVEGTGATMLFTFTLSAAQTTAVTFTVTTVGGTATAGVDYTPVSTTVTFAPGQTTQFFSVSILDDAVEEPNETIGLQIAGGPANITVPTGVVGTIIDNDTIERRIELTNQADTALGGGANDRINAFQNADQPGKLLSVEDVVNGGGGTDTLVLVNAYVAASGSPVAPNDLVDADMTNVTSVEAIQSNYRQIQLGAQADEAGIVRVDTTLSDQATNAQIAAGAGGVVLDLSLNLDGQNGPDFDNTLTVTTSNRFSDAIILDLSKANGSSFNTGTTFIVPGTVPGAPGNVTAANDVVQFVNQTAAINLTFDGNGVGNNIATGTAGLAVLASQGGQSATFDDEGTTFVATNGTTPANFVVNDGVARGTFSVVILGTSLNDDSLAPTTAQPTSPGMGSLGGSVPSGATAGIYANGGAGNDRIFGSALNDTLIGGTGDDYLEGGAGIDTLLGGAGNDIIKGGPGIDILDGGEGSDYYVYDDGEFVAAEVIADSGTGATDVDWILINSASPIVDSQFAGRTGIEGLGTNVNPNGAGAEVTVGAAAQAAGITQFVTTDDDLVGSAYTVGMTVLGYGNLTTGSGSDKISLQGPSPIPAILGGPGTSAGNFTYNGAIVSGAGDDVVNAGFALVAATTATLTGGAGTDTLVLGTIAGQPVGFGTLAAGTNMTASGSGAYDVFGAGNANFTGFEAIKINATGANRAVSYTFNIINANIDSAAGTPPLVIDGTALKAGVVLQGPDGILGTADDVTTSEVLTANGAALTGTRAIDARGGAGNDILTGGAGNDILTGGAGNDRLTGGLGADKMDGGEGSDTYVFANGEFTGVDTITDTGAAAASVAVLADPTLNAGFYYLTTANTYGTVFDNIDTLDVTSATALTDALFTGIQGVERLVSNVTTGTPSDGTAEVVLGANAQAAGIRYVELGNDDLDASAYTVGLTVLTGGTVAANGDIVVTPNAGAVTTGSGDDVVHVAHDTNTNGPIKTGAGNDRIVALGSTSLFTSSDMVDGGTGTDTFVIGGPIRYSSGSGALAIVQGHSFGLGGSTNFRGIETIAYANTDPARAVAGAANDVAGTTGQHNLTLGDGIFTDVTGRVTVDASAFKAIVTGLGTDGELGGTGGAADTTSVSRLNLDASALTAATAGLNVIGGDGNDVITTGAGNDIIHGGAGNDLITAGEGADVVFGDAGDDVLIETINQFNNNNDTFDGGDGFDTLRITAPAGNAVVADVGFNGRFSNIESVELVGQAATANFDYQAGFYSQTAGVRLINIGQNAQAGDGTPGSTTGISLINYTVSGTTVNGGDLADRLIGSNFDDTLRGGEGSDTISANGGNDTIDIGYRRVIDPAASNYNAIVENTANAVDRVDGGAGDDTIIGGRWTDQNDVLNGGSGNDTLILGVGATGYAGQTTDFSGANFINIEKIVLVAGAAPVAVAGAANDIAGTVNSYNLTFNGDNDTTAVNTNVENGQTLTIDGSALRGTAVTTLGADGEIGGTGGNADNTVTNAETLTVNGSGIVGTGKLVVIGGGGNDVVVGGAGDDTITGGNGSDTITGGGGIDTIILTETTAARDTVIIAASGDAARGATAGVENITGFATGVRGAGADNTLFTPDDTFTATADVINFTSGVGTVINENSPSITNGMVQQGTVLANGINALFATQGQAGLLAAIQLVEQEFNADSAINQGVVAFTFGGNTYIGQIMDTDPTAGVTEAFVNIVQINGITGVTSLFDTGAGMGLAV